MRTRDKHRAWKIVGWTGIAVFFLPAAAAFIPWVSLSDMVEACAIACAVLCLASGFAHKRWFLVPGTVGAGTALMVFIGYSMPTLMKALR